MRPTAFVVWLLYVLVESKWIHVKLDPVYWEDLPENEYGERRLNCHNYDPETKSRYRWRFNGSSILPKHTGTHKEELIFDKGSNAYRALFAGEYSCCIHESLGRACYTQRLLLRDPPEEIGVDLTESEVLYAKEGNTYNLRLAKSKLMEELRCDLNNHSTPENVIPLVAKRKTANHHLKIEHVSADNVGEYNCTLRLYKKDYRTKKFSVVLGSDPQLSSAFNLPLTFSIGCIVWLMILLV
nr:Hypothetical protein CBG06937 [Haemonchus contortus]